MTALVPPFSGGRVLLNGYRIWYRIDGSEDDPKRLPLLVLHGGPGMPHDYLEPLTTLAHSGRRVIFYDQLGCGNSDKPQDPTRCTLEHYLAELAAMLDALGLRKIHLLGHSWGGMLAMEHALRAPGTVASLIVASAPASIAQWMTEANRLRLNLPADIQADLRAHESAGTTEDPGYIGAMLTYYQRHVCRLEPWPAQLMQAIAKFFEEQTVYRTMFGPSEFCVTGSLKSWEIAGRLPNLRVPTLVTSGRYDEATPAIAGTVHRLIRDSEWVVFEDSAHMAHLEESSRYTGVVERFIQRVEAAMTTMKEVS